MNSCTGLSLAEIAGIVAGVVLGLPIALLLLLVGVRSIVNAVKTWKSNSIKPRVPYKLEPREPKNEEEDSKASNWFWKVIALLLVLGTIGAMYLLLQPGS